MVQSTEVSGSYDGRNRPYRRRLPSAEEQEFEDREREAFIERYGERAGNRLYAEMKAKRAVNPDEHWVLIGGSP